MGIPNPVPKRLVDGPGSRLPDLGSKGNPGPLSCI